MAGGRRTEKWRNVTGDHWLEQQIWALNTEHLIAPPTMTQILTQHSRKKEFQNKRRRGPRK